MKIISRLAVVGVVKLFGGLTDFYFFLRSRFLGDVSFEKSWRVRVRELSGLQVDVFKLYMNDGQEEKQMLCKLHIIPRSGEQVFFSFPI